MGDPGRVLEPDAELGGLRPVRELQSATRPISAIDAQIVAMAETLSRSRAVTIVTGDAQDIGQLVALTRRPNIAIDVL